MTACDRRRAAAPFALAMLLLSACAPAARPAPASDHATVEPTAVAHLPAATLGPLAVPQVVALDPPQGATGVDSARTTLTVTFDRAMDAEGWAWVVESPQTAPAIGTSGWDHERRVHSAQVALEPGRSYVVWLNSTAYPFFRDLTGRPLPPLRWTFSTAPAGGVAETVAVLPAHRRGG